MSHYEYDSVNCSTCVKLPEDMVVLPVRLEEDMTLQGKESKNQH